MNRNTSIIILTYNNLDYTKKCLHSIRRYTKENTYEIIIVDNCSTDGTRKYLEKQKDLKIILNDTNVGFPKGCNQGIELANKENDILLLNNDTIVTENWLDNLKICLNSSNDIGAVGPVCNKDENKQGVEFSYNNLEQMQQLAKKNNISNPKLWEEKTFLIGFCLLIKKEVIEKLKNLDENYTPGYIEDNDLSLQILQLGYRLILCHDSFIHHYLGTAFRKDLTKFYPILSRNRNYFFKKWNFDTFSFDDIKSASFPLITSSKKILDFNCGIGVTILALKYKYKNIEIEGIEPDNAKRLFSSKFTTVYKSLDNITNIYDCILIGDILEKIEEPEKFLKKIKSYLTEDGYLIGEIHNTASIKKIFSLLNEYSYNLNKNQKNFFTIKDIKRLLNYSDFVDIKTFSWYENLSVEETELLKKLETYNKNLMYTYYAFSCKKK